jgi:hypothetical protein
MEKPAESELTWKSKLVAKTKHYKPLFAPLQRLFIPRSTLFLRLTTFPHAPRSGIHSRESRLVKASRSLFAQVIMPEIPGS